MRSFNWSAVVAAMALAACSSSPGAASTGGMPGSSGSASSAGAGGETGTGSAISSGGSGTGAAVSSTGNGTGAATGSGSASSGSASGGASSTGGNGAGSGGRSLCGGGGFPAPRIPGALNTAAGGTRLYTDAGVNLCLYSAAAVGMEVGSGPSSAAGGDACGSAFGWTAQTAASVAGFVDAGFNAARVELAWANLEPSAPQLLSDGGLIHAWNAAYVAAIDGMVSALTADGVAVILDFHHDHLSPAFKAVPGGAKEGDGTPVWLFPVTGQPGGCDPDAGPDDLTQGMKDFAMNVQENDTVTEKPWEGLAAAWTFIAHRYGPAGSQPTPLIIGADLFNEPYMFSPSYVPDGGLLDFYTELAAAVRAEAPGWLIIYESCAQGETDVNKLMACPDTRPLSRRFSSTVYSYHLYVGASQSGCNPSFTSTDATDIDYELGLAQSAGAPFWIGEFNIDLADAACVADAGYYEAALRPMYELMADAGISWDYFSFEPTGAPYCEHSFSSALCLFSHWLAQQYF